MENSNGNGDKMGSRAYAAYEKTFMLFGSLTKSFAPGVPVEDWQGWADQWLDWSQKKAKELVDEAYNGKEEKTENPPPPEEKKEENVRYANDAQAKRIYGKAMNAGFTKETFKAFLERHNCKDAWHIPLSKYDDLCELASDAKVAAQFGKEF
ncbi:MAG: hypothetical protein HY268_13860 [Deltaproteobacteria bacterium]|nr:hypothetical protein [Deltaproteobacteria bacterium]